MSKEVNNNKIDFVVTWVDSTDIEWQKDKEKYNKDVSKSNQCDSSQNRYKDWGLFRYWFRGVEKFAPWVNNVYLITYGHIPKWLNINNPKLKIIKHEDYIPKEYLPTFNSNVIEMNIDKIKELSENFVLFNDDMYLINNTKATDFFVDNKPCDTIGLNVHCPLRSKIIQQICINNSAIINEYYDMKKILKRDWKKWYNLKNGKSIIRTFVLSNCPRFPGFWQHHLPSSYKKSNFKIMWEKEYDALNNTSKNKFRSANDINHWLIRDFQIAEGEYVIRSNKFGKVFNMGGNNPYQKGKYLLKYLDSQSGKCICINDGETTGEEFEKFIMDVKNCFDKILPEKSSFEI